MTTNPSRRRALHATRAVTFGGFALAAACGTTPEPVPDTGTDTSTDVTEDTSVDATPDVAPDTIGPDTMLDIGTSVCSTESDGVCPEGCSQEEDIDCCLANNDDFEWCSFDPSYGCSCAVEGPFAPPTFE